MPVTEHGQDNENRQPDKTAIMRRAPQHLGGRPDRPRSLWRRTCTPVHEIVNGQSPFPVTGAKDLLFFLPDFLKWLMIFQASGVGMLELAVLQVIYAY